MGRKSIRPLSECRTLEHKIHENYKIKKYTCTTNNWKILFGKQFLLEKSMFIFLKEINVPVLIFLLGSRRKIYWSISFMTLKTYKYVFFFNKEIIKHQHHCKKDPLWIANYE